MLKFFARLLCFFFGHKPTPVTFLDRAGQVTNTADLQVFTLGEGPSIGALCFNVCNRCNELTRSHDREPLVTEKIRGMIQGEAMAKEAAGKAENAAKADAWAKRQRGESIQAHRERLKGKNPFAPEATPEAKPAPLPVPPPKLAAVPDPKPENA